MWYLRGKISSDAAIVDLEAAGWQRRQQQFLRTVTKTRMGNEASAECGGDCDGDDLVLPIYRSPVLSSSSLPSSSSSLPLPPSSYSGSGSVRETSAAAAEARTAVTVGSSDTAVERFLQRLADSMGPGCSSLLGGLPPEEEDVNVRFSGGRKETAATATTSTKASPPLPTATTPAPDHGFDEKQRRGGASTPPQLVLFARAKGRPFVYCGAVDCIAQECVWNSGSSQLGAVRFTLALKEYREAALAPDAVLGAGFRSDDGGGVSRGVDEAGRENAFMEVVREGLRPPVSESGVPSEGSTSVGG